MQYKSIMIPDTDETARKLKQYTGIQYDRSLGLILLLLLLLFLCFYGCQSGLLELGVEIGLEMKGEMGI